MSFWAVCVRLGWPLLVAKWLGVCAAPVACEPRASWVFLYDVLLSISLLLTPFSWWVAPMPAPTCRRRGVRQRADPRAGPRAGGADRRGRAGVDKGAHKGARACGGCHGAVRGRAEGGRARGYTWPRVPPKRRLEVERSPGWGHRGTLLGPKHACGLSSRRQVVEERERAHGLARPARISGAGLRLGLGRPGTQMRRPSGPVHHSCRCCWLAARASNTVETCGDWHPAVLCMCEAAGRLRARLPLHRCLPPGPSARHVRPSGRPPPPSPQAHSQPHNMYTQPPPAFSPTHPRAGRRPC